MEHEQWIQNQTIINLLTQIKEELETLNATLQEPEETKETNDTNRTATRPKRREE